MLQKVYRGLTGFMLAAALQAATPLATTPIEHVIVVVGENRTFDNLFGTYQPMYGQRVSNLLSRGIVKADGSPGPNFHLAEQHEADVHDVYSAHNKPVSGFKTLPQPWATGAFGQRRDVPDARFPDDLPNGPFPITRFVDYGAHTGDPMHRFFQMWQQVNGGDKDMFVWVASTVGSGPDTPGVKAGQTGQGAVSMGFYNMAGGDAPYFKELADHYALADNYHQPIMGGTTVNYMALATADVGFYTKEGKAAVPPANQIENPDPQPTGNNWYKHDGYAGGTYVNCADTNAPGVAGIRKVLEALPYKPFNNGNCAADHYYMVNNLDPSYSATGKALPLGDDKFLLPPQTNRHIGDLLTEAGLPWKWYSGGRNDGVKVDTEYCGMCDTPTFFTSTMTGPDKSKLADLQQFYVDVHDAKSFPSVAVIAPYDSISGHPGYAMQPSFEHLVSDVVNRVKANPALWKNTAILVTVDEGGGYYDSGYIQLIDFFGDGTRIPMLAVSPWAKHGQVDHTYYDHASIAKFIERNWNLNKLSDRSRDNLPNPVAKLNEPYIPVNRPAIGDLMNLFDFSRAR